MSQKISLKTEDGEAIWRFQSSVTFKEGKAILDIQCRRLSNVGKVRIFFENESDYNVFRFIYDCTIKGPDTVRSNIEIGTG